MEKKGELFCSRPVRGKNIFRPKSFGEGVEPTQGTVLLQGGKS